MFVQETENMMSPERRRQIKESLAKAVAMPHEHRSAYPTAYERERAERFKELIQEQNEQANKSEK